MSASSARMSGIDGAGPVPEDDDLNDIPDGEDDGFGVQEDDQDEVASGGKGSGGKGAGTVRDDRGGGQERIEEVPDWDGDLRKFKNYKRRVAVWLEHTTTKSDKQGPRLLSRLTGDAWVCTEDISMKDLRTGGPKYLLSFLEDALEVEDFHLCGRAMEEYFFGVRRENKEHINKYCTRQKAAYNRMKELGVTLDEKAQAYWLLKRANLSTTERQSILTQTGGKYKMESIIKAMQVTLVMDAGPPRDHEHHRQRR